MRLFSPYYSFAALLSLTCTLVVLVGMTYLPVIGFFLVITIYAFFFSFKRATSLMTITADQLTITQFVGQRFTVLSNAAGTKISVNRKNDYELEGLTFEESTALKKGIGNFIRILIRLVFKKMLSSTSEKSGMEDFIILTATLPSGVSQQIFLPNVYSWNKAAYIQMEQWLKDKGMAYQMGETINWNDEDVQKLGKILSLSLILTGMLLVYSVVISMKAYQHDDESSSTSHSRYEKLPSP